MSVWHHLALAVFSFGIGASVGSFLNVCVWRMPRGESLIRPASRCPRCGVSIRAFDNVPILGWIFLKGRCRSCREAISPRYPLVEAGVGLLFTFIVLAETTLPEADPFDRGLGMVTLRAMHHALLASLFVAVTLIDYDARRGREFAPLYRERRLHDAWLLITAFGILSCAAQGDAIGAALNMLLVLVILKPIPVGHSSGVADVTLSAAGHPQSPG